MIDNFRGQPVFDIELCFSCGLCSKNCPSMAIQMIDVKGKKCPQINLGKCIFCYKCVEDCPKGAIKNSTNFELATTTKSSLVITPQRDKQITK